MTKLLRTIAKKLFCLHLCVQTVFIAGLEVILTGSLGHARLYRLHLVQCLESDDTQS